MQKRTALIPDPRNDENLIVAQTHLAMIRFHNRVVDKLPGDAGRRRSSGEARKSVTLHYQWLIRHDYLPRIVQENVLDDVFTNGRKLVEPDARSRPTYRPCRSSSRSPAFRLGHSMVRAGVRLEPALPRRRPGRCSTCSTSPPAAAPSAATSSSPATGSPTGGGCTTSRTGGHADLAGPNGVNKAQRIDTLVADPLKFLPASVFGEKEEDVDFNDPARNLAFRNLIRGSMLKLASGQQMVERLQARWVSTSSR